MRDWSGVRQALELEAQVMLIWVPILLGIGISLFFSLGSEPSLASLIAVTGAASIAGITSFFVRGLSKTLCAAAGGILMGFTIAGMRTHMVAAPILNWHFYGQISGDVVDIDRSASGALRLTLMRNALAGIPEDQTPVRLRISLFGDHPPITQLPGRRITTTAHLSPPKGPVEPGGFDFQRYAWFARLGGLGYTRNPLLFDGGTSEQSNFLSWRMSISSHVQRAIPGQAGAFAAAIMSGDRSGLSEETLKALRGSNLAHLLAISGLHMGLLTSFVYGLMRLLIAVIPYLALRNMPRMIGACCAIVIGAFYLGLSGGNVATERAFIMAAVAFMAILLKRRAVSIRSVALAATLILVIRPEALMGPGFQMSFAATIALVQIFGAITSRTALKGPRWVKFVIGTALSSAVAGAATLPVAAAHFNQIAHLGWIANVVSVPLMGAWIIPLAVIALAGIPFGLDGPVFLAMGYGLEWILWVAHTAAAYPGAVSHVISPPSWAFGAIMLGALACLVLRSQIRWLGLAGCLVGIVGWGQVTRPTVLVTEDGKLVGLMGPTGRALSRSKGSGFAAKVWLENDGHPKPQYKAALDWSVAQTMVELRGGRVLHFHGKRGLAKFDTCHHGDVAVFSETVPKERRQHAPCLILDPTVLRKTGSLALKRHQNLGWAVHTAKQASGARLWNTPRLRQ